MSYITPLKASKILHLTHQHFLAKCHKGDFNLLKCDCGRSYLVDEDEVKSASYKKHQRSGYGKFNKNINEEV